MTRDEEADLINEIVIAQGELLRLIIWLKDSTMTLSR